jgi:hypothetical protein
MKLKPPRTRSLGKVAGFQIYLVSGQTVRDKHDQDFTMGGNDGVYTFYIPTMEIWIDDAQNGNERTSTALHEMVERDLMVNYGLTYDAAHDIALSYEKPFRKLLNRAGVTTFDRGKLATAYKGYLRSQAKLAPAAKYERHPAQVKRDIDAALSGKPR